MRLHHLGVTAFGPFAQTVEIDFDALSASGLFLLTGPTGAGKTSVLDAVCFALYGDVPGDRSAAKRLRSDHAPPGTAPEVSLEATLAGRRFRFVRSPAWERPKKRGSGTTRQQSHVVVTERVEGRWETLSTRLDEAGDLVQSLVGMNLDQFCQVAMLPQGRFQAFLRARSEDRQALLQQLFQTGRFARMEAWMRDRRLGLHRASRECHDEVAGWVNRFSEAASHPCPDEWDPVLLDGPAADGSLRAWADAGVRCLLGQVLEAEQALAALTAAEQEACTALEDARDLARRQDRLHSAERQLVGLAQQQDAQEYRLSELDAARRAAAVLPLCDLARSTRRRTVELEALEVRLAAHVEDLGHPLSPDTDLLTAQASVGRERRSLGPALEAEEGLPVLRSRLALQESQHAEARRARRAAQELLTKLPERRTALHEKLRRALQAGARLPECQAKVDELGRRLLARAEADELAAELDDAEEQRRAFRDEAQALVQEWLDLREARLAGMAAEIAGALSAGCDCPVCGSAEHPRPASPVPGAPDAAAERAAQRRADDARAVLLAHDDRVQQLRTRVEVARAGSGEESDPLDDLLAEAREHLAEVTRLAGEAEEHEQARDSLAAEEERLHDELRSRERETAQLETSVLELGRELRRRTGMVQDALAGTSSTTVGELCARLDALEGALRELAAAQEGHRTLCEQLLQHEEALASAVAEQRFADAEAARAAARTPARQEELATVIRRHDEQRAALRAVLDDPALAAAAAQPPPDVPSLEHQHGEVRSLYDAARTEADRVRRACGRAESLRDELGQALDRWRPVRDEHATVAALASLVEGKSADNRLQMRLAAYVLAFRLTQVVQAANARLSTMSDQRYSLQHSGQKGAGETRGGLSLTVLDEWSGASRDPATLSGGESFIVSLALALGLADVITQEAGGTDLDTLFVDEGFGSLDADSLDHVLDTLDSLRDGGRVVGVVSHVTEMSERIPTQLRVSKDRRGSTVAVVAAG